MAIARHSDGPYDRYSLLAGGDRYKTSLATDREHLYWLTVRRS